MRNRYLLYLCLFSCSISAQHYKVRSIASERIEVTAALDETPDENACRILSPYKGKVDSVMAPVLGMSRIAMDSRRPESLLSNWMADVLLDTSTATGMPKADMSLVNIGGIRNNMPKGIVRKGDVLLIAPFDNSLVVLELKGSALQELMENIAAVHGEGVSSNVRMEITKEGALLSASIGGQPIDKDKTYTIATIDYLAEGNDKMYALTKRTKMHNLGITVRDALMEYIIKNRVIDSKIEGRITVKER